MLEITNDVPSYMLAEGAGNWTVRLPCGANASAIRDSVNQCWTVFPPNGEHYEIAAHFDKDQVICYLKGLLKDSLIKSLALLV